MNALDTWMVGGAVRDRRLGRTVRDRDWVVVGSTAQQMLALGFRQVGRDFPVFLHPETHEEYALARTERKTAPGHTGFEVHAEPEVTLEEDLARRDLTINAIAENAAGEVCDPYGGCADLEARVLRHVTPAFREDPLRVLRTARFAAQLSDYGFGVAPETLQQMREIAGAGEIAHLSRERIWGELHKALAAPQPSRFLEVLLDAQCLGAVFEALPAVRDATMLDRSLRMGLDSASAFAEETRAVAERFAVLVTLGVRDLTGPARDSASGERAKAACAALGAPNVAARPATLLAEFRRVLVLSAGTTALDLLEGALRGQAQRPEAIESTSPWALLVAATLRLMAADGADAHRIARTKRILGALPEAMRIGVDAESGATGAEIGEAVRTARLQRINRLLRDH